MSGPHSFPVKGHEFSSLLDFKEVVYLAALDQKLKVACESKGYGGVSLVLRCAGTSRSPPNGGSRATCNFRFRCTKCPGSDPATWRVTVSELRHSCTPQQGDQVNFEVEVENFLRLKLEKISRDKLKLEANEIEKTEHDRDAADGIRLPEHNNDSADLANSDESGAEIENSSLKSNLARKRKLSQNEAKTDTPLKFFQHMLMKTKAYNLAQSSLLKIPSEANQIFPNNHEEIREYLYAAALQQGYRLVVHGKRVSASEKRSGTAFSLSCVQANMPKEERKEGDSACPAYFKCAKNGENKWHVTESDLRHNHEPDEKVVPQKQTAAEIPPEKKRKFENLAETKSNSSSSAARSVLNFAQCTPKQTWSSSSWNTSTPAAQSTYPPTAARQAQSNSIASKDDFLPSVRKFCHALSPSLEKHAELLYENGYTSRNSLIRLMGMPEITRKRVFDLFEKEKDLPKHDKFLFLAKIKIRMHVAPEVRAA